MSPRTDILGLTSPELLAQAAVRLPSGAGVAARIYAGVFATGRFDPEAAGVSRVSAAAWSEHYRAGLLDVRGVTEEPGEIGVTSKAVLAAEDGSLVECVRVPVATSTGEVRFTLCVSSQVGCRMGCLFCETGSGGFIRDLTAAEIVGQVLTTRHTLSWVCRNIVFMGMGEPLDNLDHVAQALRVLTDSRGFRYSWERITVCTSGVGPGIERLRTLGHKRLNLSVSLNTADPATRRRLMPVTRLTDLPALSAVLAGYPRRRGFVLGVNYCLLPGLNDTPDDARAVGAWLAGVGRAQLNLIPYNPGRAAITRAPTSEETERFAHLLRGQGVDVKVRLARGHRIMAGCGQLGRSTTEET